MITINHNPNWKQNLYILLFGTFITGLAFNEVIPFMSLYITQLGKFNHGQLSLLSGVVYAASFLVVAFTAPMWGRFADQHGRKRMILQTSLGSAITIFLMAFVTNVWQFIFLRLLQGFFDGVIPNSIALIATEVPKHRAQYSLSLLSTGYTSGFLIGPVFGGILVNYLSIRLTFVLTGLLLFSFFLLTLTSVTENFKPDPKQRDATGLKIFKQFPNPKLIIWMMTITVIVQTAVNFVFPILTLFVKQLMNNHGPIAIVSGLIAALPGIGMVITSPSIGRYGDKHGASQVLTIGFVIVMLSYFPQGLATGVLMLGVFRFINGIGNAAVFPSIQTVYAKGTPEKLTGMAFSLNQGAQAIGAVIGSLGGGVISTYFSYRAVFIMAGVLIIFNFLILRYKLSDLKTLLHED